MGAKKRVSTLPRLTPLRSSCEESMGVRLSAAAVETIITMLMLQPSWRNITPASPGVIVSGRKTASIVSVEAMTEIPTSFVPWMAACLGALPRSMCVVTFSSTTIASSTTIPMAMESEEREMTLSELPETSR